MSPPPGGDGDDRYGRFLPELDVAEDGPVRIVTLRRPDSLNAIDSRLHRSLTEIWPVITADEGARAVVLTGAGSAFSAGGDLDTITVLHEDLVERKRQITDANDIVLGMIRCRVPVVAAVNGPAVGLGCSIALLADLVYLARSAYLADPHVRIGLVAGDGGAALWPVLTSMLRAKELLYTGDRVPAEEAVQLGLATRVLDDDELLPAAMAMGHRLAALPRQAVEATKRALNLHLVRAVSGVLDFALAAEHESFDTDEHRAIVARMRKR